MLTRRSALTGAALLPLGCPAARVTRSERGEGGAAAEARGAAPLSEVLDAASSSEVDEHVLEFPSSPVGPERALALVPRARPEGGKLPVLVALHGRGEAVRGLDVGARAWRDDYWLTRAISHLMAPPLSAEAFQGLVRPDRLQRINASLVERPYRGLVIVCPWVPDLLTDAERSRPDAAAPFGRFLTEQLLPAVIEALPASAERNATGLDGVSLGGRVALLAGFGHAERFGSVDSLQAAIQQAELPGLVERARRAAEEGRALNLRLVTSERDYFRVANGRFHELLRDAHVAHELLVLPGPHDYVWNRGPGAIEMLLWHDRVLRGEAPI